MVKFTPRQKFLAKRAIGKWRRMSAQSSVKPVVVFQQRRIPFGLPTTMVCKMRYMATENIDPTAGGWVTTKYNANSLYEPLDTNHAHQPTPFADMAQFYKHFEVLWSKCTVQPCTPATSNVNPAYLFVMLSKTGTDSQACADVNEALQQDRRSKIVSTTGMISAGQQPDYGKCIRTFTAKKFFGLKDAIDAHECVHEVATNPTRRAYFEVNVASMGGNDPGSVWYTIQIDYIVRCSDNYSN